MRLPKSRVMEKFFNTAGPMINEDHYYISSFERFDYEEIEYLIAQKRYFVLHAPRQTGKTSALLEMMDRINSEKKYCCLYANIETAQTSRENITNGIRTVCEAIARSARIFIKNSDLSKWLRENKREIEAGELLTTFLEYWTQNSSKPTILFIDEVDALIGDTLISLLRQLRNGYNQRPSAFPTSIILCGIRDVKDYRIRTKDNEIITGGSAFNIKTTSLTLKNFTYEECKKLWLQHTKHTGQKFEESIFPKLWSDTKGQPWLVNALAYELTWKNKILRKEREKLITLEHYKKAREILIHSRATHLDQLIDKLQEPRVHKVVSAILSGKKSFSDIKSDDQQYVQDLGLIVTKPKVAISNDIYKETIPRELTWVTQTRILNEPHWYIKKNNSIDMIKLLKAFQQFFRENADSWIEKFDYKEAGPQLLLQAFLQRIVNGGGRINREYGLGRKRTDIFIEYPTDKKLGFFGENIQRIVIETKLLYSNLDKTINDGLKQIFEYSDLVGAKEQHLIIFNRDGDETWEDKIWIKEKSYNGKKIFVWGS